MTMSKMKKTLTNIFIGVAVFGSPVAGGFAGGYLYDRYAGPVTVPQSLADIPEKRCYQDFCVNIPQDEREARLAAIHADPEKYRQKVAQEEKFLAVIMGTCMPAMLMVFASMAIATRQDGCRGPRP